MGSEESKNEAYENRCKDFLDYFKGEKENLKLEKQNDDLIKKIREEKITKIKSFIKKLIQDEEKKNCFDEMEKIFLNLIDKYDINHIEDNENKKTFSENIDDNEKNVINAIYISKIIDEEDLSIHDYALELYDEKEVEKIEKGDNKNINEVFKKYEKLNSENDENKDDIEPSDEEINNKYNQICTKNGIIPQNDSAQAEPKSTQINENNPINNVSNINIPKNSDDQKNIPQNSNNNQPDSLYKNTYNDSTVSDYYDIVFDIDSLENLKMNGWKFEAKQEGYDKYLKKKDERNTVVSVIGNKNKGKSFILAKISRKKIPDGHNITTRGLSVIYPDYDEKNVIFLDTAGFEIPLCEDESVFKFETNNKEYLEKKKNNEKISVKDYISEEEYIDQIMKFTRDRQNTDYFLQKFIMNSADILLCIVNKLDLSDQKFLKRIQDENKDKKIFIIHNLKTISKINDVENYINDTLLKVLSFRLQKALYTETNDKKNNSNPQNNIYYKQKFLNETNTHREVIHLFMAKDSSEAGDYYNDSTINFIINQIMALTNNKPFDILEQVKKYLAENSEKFFNEGIDEKDLKITDEGDKLLKYENKEKPFELKECYVDELGNTNFIQSNYKPYYRVYIANYIENEKKTPKLIIDVEISGKVEDLDIKKVSQNKNNIITIKGKRMLGKKKDKKEQNEDKTEENSNEKKKNIKKYIKEYKSSYFDEEPTPFNLRIFIPNEKCIIGDLFKPINFYEKEGLYRLIYDIQNIQNSGPIKPVVITDSDEEGEIISD